MCGIIAYTGPAPLRDILMEGLRQLEYRGYDSAGVAIVHRKKLRVWKAAGKLSMLETQLPEAVQGDYGIGHTRWATHGAPTDANAHPHIDSTGRIAVVHNGMVENASTLRHQLRQSGTKLSSDTDSELLAHLIAHELNRDDIDLTRAVRHVLQLVRGTYGIAVIDAKAPGIVVVARMGSPVILGVGKGQMWAASDLSAMVRHTQDVIHLDDGELATLSPNGFEVTTLAAASSKKTATRIQHSTDDYDRGGYTHFLRKEIFDQPAVLERTLRGRLDRQFSTAHLGGLNLQPRGLLDIKRIKVLGCGSAYYAGLAGANMIETLARLPSDAEPAAEFRYRNPLVEKDTLYVAVSQSGETFDTLAAVREIKRKGGYVLGVINSVGSTIAREVDGGVYLRAGAEVSVASTKAYTSTLAVFSLLALMLGRLRDVSPQRGGALVESVSQLPHLVGEALQLDGQTQKVARDISKAHSMFFLGRTSACPVAMEGAQKLKEISYIHAEAYPSSELKHGPLALVTKYTPCVVVLPDNELLEKSLSSLEELKTRGAPVITVTDSWHERISELSDHVLRTPACEELLRPVVMSVPLQLLAYNTALILKRDIDQPRNLAKSVTVE
ncbi:MAG: glutamine--fructose-6-phosphate transaminase (isomerizing) [Granulosicoccus sp.]